MARRNPVTVLAALGGVLVIIGGVLGFLLSFAPGGFGGRYDRELGALLVGVLAVVVGLVILVVSGYTHYRGVRHTLGGAIVLVILGLSAWVAAGEWLLVAVGGLLTVVAGLVLLGQVFYSDPIARTIPPP